MLGRVVAPKESPLLCRVQADVAATCRK